jgi:Flp pilus assembly protein TadG
MIKTTRRSLRRLACHENGNVMALFAIGLPMLVGAVGLAVDTAHWVLLKRQLQQVADSAAVSGSLTAVHGGDIDFAVDQDASRRRAEIGPMFLRATLSPDGHIGDPNAVAVTASAPARFSFASMFMSKPLVVSASATATLIASNDFCAFALGSSTETGIEIGPNSEIQSECGVTTNSSAPDSLRGDASSKFAARKLFAAGGIFGADSRTSGHVVTHALQQSDPGADLVMPEVPNTGCPNITVNPGESNATTLQAGCYGNLVLNGRVVLKPGNYILNRGNMIFGPKADVSCEGCTFFLTSQDANVSPGSIGKAKVDPSASLNLSAPQDGTYAGLLMFQDRRAGPEAKGDENVVGANSQSKLDGILYFPAQSLRVDASAAPNLKCARLIGRKLVLGGRLMIGRGCSADNAKINLSAAEVRLVD